MIDMWQHYHWENHHSAAPGKFARTIYPVSPCKEEKAILVSFDYWLESSHIKYNSIMIGEFSIQHLLESLRPIFYHCCLTDFNWVFVKLFIILELVLPIICTSFALEWIDFNNSGSPTFYIDHMCCLRSNKPVNKKAHEERERGREKGRRERVKSGVINVLLIRFIRRYPFQLFWKNWNLYC